MDRKILLGVVASTILLLTASVVMAQGGFDEFGYNYQARVFVGPADGVDRILDGEVWGDPTYANDHLVMKWSKGWDDARFHGGEWACDAWENNEWNGMVPGGSGEVWHYKIVWVGSEKYDLTGTWTYVYHYGGKDYVHTMTIDNFNKDTGEFSGTGFYNPDHSYTWDITGTVVGNTISYHIDYTGSNPTYYVDGTGTISADGLTMSGDATAPGQVATWTATTGTSVIDNGPFWREGGYRIWGQFEVIMDMGTYDGEHVWLTHAIPTGYGA